MRKKKCQHCSQLVHMVPHVIIKRQYGKPDKFEDIADVCPGCDTQQTHKRQRV